MQNRIHSIDAIRGFCLLNIFVNHLAVGSLQQLSPSNYGFSDSAEAFVLLAGVSSYLAYGPRNGRAVFPAGATRMWARAWTLFLYYALLAAASVVILLVSEPWARSFHLMPGQLIEAHGLLEYTWQVLTMQENVGYSMILRLYVALLLIGPAYVWLAAKRFWYPLVPAALIWALAGQLGLADHGSLSGGQMSLSILPWNLVFAAGIAIGAALQQGVRLPTPRWLTVTAAVVVAAGIVGGLGGYLTVADGFWTGLSKPLQSPLRIVHVLALAYLFVAWREAPAIRSVHAVKADNLFCRLGRHSLQVFTWGTILATAGRQALWWLVWRAGFEVGSAAVLAVELTFVGLGLAAMVWIADRPAAKPARAALQPAAA